MLAHPSPKMSKAYRSRACCTRKTKSRHAKAPKDQRTRGASIANNDNHRLEQTNIKPHQQTRKLTGSWKIRRGHDSTCPPRMLDAPLERGYDEEDLFLTPRCSHRFTISKKTLKNCLIRNGTLPPARWAVVRPASKTLRPSGQGRVATSSASGMNPKWVYSSL
jgi:hypothetical protein